MDYFKKLKFDTVVLGDNYSTRCHLKVMGKGQGCAVSRSSDTRYFVIDEQ